MIRRTLVLAVVLAGLLGAGWFQAADVRAQGAPPTPWLAVAHDFASALATGDLSRVASYTTAEYQARLVSSLAGQPPGCALSGDGLVQNGALLRADYAAVQLLCRHPDGVEEFVTLTVRLTASGWRVCGGFTPK